MSEKEFSETGQGLVEYALILVLVAIVVIVVLAILGPSIGNVYTQIVSALEGPIISMSASRTGGGTGNDVIVHS